MKKKFENVQSFTHPQFGLVRIIKKNNEPLFCLNDICEGVGLNSNGVKARLNPQYISTHPIADSIGRQQQANFVTEAGLYDIILDSRKKEAKAFRAWVVGDVLPAIRKEGAYVHATPNDTPESIEAKAHQAAQMAIAHLRQQIQAQNQELAIKDIELAEKDLQIETTEHLLAIQQPLINFAQAVLPCHESMRVNVFSKVLAQNGYPFGEKKLYKWLRDNEYLCSCKYLYNVPTQKYMDKGYFAVHYYIFYDAYARPHYSHTTYITPLGQAYFLNLFNRLRANAQ